MRKYRVMPLSTYFEASQAWAIGFTAADGSLVVSNRTSDSNTVSYTLSQKDTEVLYKIKHSFGVENPVGLYRNSQDKDIAMLRFVSESHEKIMFDMLDIKSTFPAQFMDFRLNRHYLRGMFDGDGCIHYRKRGGILLVFVNEKENIVKDFSYSISRHLGLAFKVPKPIEKDNLYRIQYESREARIVAWYMYHGEIQDISLARKLRLYHGLVNHDSDDPNQFFQCVFGINMRYTPKITPKGMTLPLSMGPSGDSLKLCQTIQKVLHGFGIECTPVFKNKGYYKYYVPYFPMKSVRCIETLRSLVEKQEMKV